MAEKKRRNWIALGAAVFVVYLFAASSPAGTETSLKPRWLRPLDAPKTVPDRGAEAKGLVPFSIADHFGYFDSEGRFSFVKDRPPRLSLSANAWSVYDALAETTEAKSPMGDTLFVAKERGYPYFADGRAFLISPEQNGVAALDSAGAVKWRRDFAAPITCADAESGLAVFGLLDGSLEVINEAGERIYAFEPGGSRLSVAVGVRLSPDGRKLAVFSGIDQQRFLLLERSGHTYKVIHHENIGVGLRRALRSAFVGDAQYVAFETEKGLAVYDIERSRTHRIALNGRVAAFEDRGEGTKFFCILETPSGRTLAGVELPDYVFMRAPYKSGENFLARRGDFLYIGGASSIAALGLETK